MMWAIAVRDTSDALKSKRFADGRFDSAACKPLFFIGNTAQLTATPLSHACLHISRHLAQISLDRRKPVSTKFIQSDEKSDCTIARQ